MNVRKDSPSCALLRFLTGRKGPADLRNVSQCAWSAPPRRKTSPRRDKKTNGGRIIMTFAFCETKMAARQTARRPGNSRTVHLTPLPRRFGTHRSLQAAATRMPCVCAVWGRHCALFDALAFRRTKKWESLVGLRARMLSQYSASMFPPNSFFNHRIPENFRRAHPRYFLRIWRTTDAPENESSGSNNTFSAKNQLPERNLCFLL